MFFLFTKLGSRTNWWPGRCEKQSMIADQVFPAQTVRIQSIVENPDPFHFFLDIHFTGYGIWEIVAHL